MRRLLVVLGAVGLVLGLASCGDDSGGGGGGSAATADDLDGNSFTSTEAENFDLAEGTTITMTFEGGTLGFSAGCNQMSAPYEITDGTLALTAEPAGTLIACPDDLQAQDTLLTGFLTDGAEVTLDGETLTLTGPDVTLVLEQD